MSELAKAIKLSSCLGFTSFIFYMLVTHYETIAVKPLPVLALVILTIYAFLFYA